MSTTHRAEVFTTHPERWGPGYNGSQAIGVTVEVRKGTGGIPRRYHLYVNGQHVGWVTGQHVGWSGCTAEQGAVRGDIVISEARTRAEAIDEVIASQRHTPGPVRDTIVVLWNPEAAA